MDKTKLNNNGNSVKSTEERIAEKSLIHDKKLIAALEKHYKDTGRPWSIIQRLTGVSQSILSQWRNCAYPGDVEAVQDKIRRFLVSETQRADSNELIFEYVETKNTRKIINMLHTAQVDGLMTCVIGDTGSSKTTAIQKFAETHNVIQISANRSYKSPIEYIRRIHESTFVGGDGKGTLNEMTVGCIRELHGKKIQVIIDQSDYLLLPSIDVLRTLNDEANIAIAFVGLPNFLNTLRGNEPEVRQVRDRLRMKVELSPPGVDDVEKILEVNFPEAIVYCKELHTYAKGSLRILQSLVYNIKRLIKNGELIEEKTIERAARLLERRYII